MVPYSVLYKRSVDHAILHVKKASTLLAQQHEDAFHPLHGPEVPLYANQEGVKHWNHQLMDLCYCLALENLGRRVLSSADVVTISVDQLLIDNSAFLRTVS